MQGYRVFEESIIYTTGKDSCEIIFYSCSEPYKLYPIYDLELVINNATDIGEAQETFNTSGLKRIILATIEVLDDWCNRHPYTFISFFDCLSNLWRFYFKLGFVFDGRGETFIAFINEEGKRVAFRGMLNLLTEDDFWVNDIWRVAKDSDYYIGNIYTPVDLLKDLLVTE